MKMYGKTEGSLERKPRCKCGKICFDKKGAQTKANWLIKMGNEKNLRIYQCDEDTNFWHLTKAMYHDENYD